VSEKRHPKKQKNKKSNQGHSGGIQAQSKWDQTLKLESEEREAGPLEGDFSKKWQEETGGGKYIYSNVEKIYPRRKAPVLGKAPKWIDYFYQKTLSSWNL